MFKVGQKVVCVEGGDWANDYGYGELCSGPETDEILTIDFLEYVDGYPPHLGFNKYGTEEGFAPEYFRPIDFNFGEVVAEHIEEKINQEQLQNV